MELLGNKEKVQMNKNGKKEPITNEQIFKIMRNIAFVVAAIFFVKDLIAGEIGSAIFIGACLAAFAVVLVIMNKLHVGADKQQFVVSIVLMLLIFFISINSGIYYSDDYMLYLASYALAGLYLNPNITKVQIVLGDVLFIIMYLLKPQNVESTSQYIMCMVTFTLAGIMIYLVIQRGRAFIEQSNSRAKEAVTLIESMRNIGEELQLNFENSSGRMDALKAANAVLGNNALELKDGSMSISNEAHIVVDSCDQVHEKLEVTENQILALEDEMHRFEEILSYNRNQMVEMGSQVSNIKTTITEANNVFQKLNTQMEEINNVLSQLNAISSKTTMLALNASIEAARAGQAGVGFAVVAEQVKALAVDSSKCANEVAIVVATIQDQINKTSAQLVDSTESIDISLETLDSLQGAFGQLNEQFGSLHSNIEVQNNNIDQVNVIFSELKEKISVMSNYSEENQAAVQSITDTIEAYKGDIEIVIDDTQQIHELSESMINISNEK